jgi:hypothetical protein
MSEYRDVALLKLKWDVLLVCSAAVAMSALILALILR